MDKKAVIIPIMSQKISFWIGVARILASDYRVIILTRPDVCAVIKRLAPELLPCAVDAASLMKEAAGKDFDTVSEALRLESTYGVQMAMLLSERRDLGKGYLFNADKHPYMESAWWGHEEKLVKIVKDFLYYEMLMERYGPVSFWIGEHAGTAQYRFLGSKGIHFFSLGKIKYGGRFCWNDGPHYQCSDFFQRLTSYIQNKGCENIELADFEAEKLSSYRDGLLQFGYGRALKQVGNMAVAQTRHKIKRALLAAIGKPLPKKHGYGYMGWAPPVMRRTAMFRYFERHGLKPQNLSRYRLVYFPMHMEPEVAVMAVSPEFTNSLELVTWLSKALPADTLIVVKENMHSLGVRSRRYYDNFRMIGNVVLAHPEVSSWEWIKRCNLTATITGTAAIEAVYFNRPVLSFGKHQAVNLLPVCRYARDFETTLQAVKELLDIPKDDKAFDVARSALFRAQMESSFELPDVPALLNYKKLCMANSKTALRNLFEKFPELETSPIKDRVV